MAADHLVPPLINFPTLLSLHLGEMERSKGLITATRSLSILVLLSGSRAAVAVSSEGQVQNQVAGKEKSNPFAATFLILIFIVLGVIALVLVLLLLRAYFERRKLDRRDARELDTEKKKDERPSEHRENTGAGNEEIKKLEFLTEEGGFELRDLLKASASAMGKGNFGAWYKAKLENGASVLVKRLKDLIPFTSDEFAKHMKALSDLKHPNLLPLLAYYNSKDEKLLVYRFAANGNLFDRIHAGRGENRVPFKWQSRLQVARGVARAMAFLHFSSKSPNAVPHGNLKSSNVVLDENDKPLVSDYGLSSIISSSAVEQRMVVYRSPEYQHRRKVSKKSDVWSYGALLLELLTGKASCLSYPGRDGGIDLCNWAHRAVREEWTAEIFDTEIAEHRNAGEELLKLLQIALRCCEKSPEKRPEMEDVMRSVDGIAARKTWEGYDDESDRSSVDDLSGSTSASGISADDR